MQTLARAFLEHESMEQKPTYIIFARYPEPNKAKTRLLPTLGAEETLRLYTAMMLDIIERILQRDTPVMLCVFPSQRVEDFRALLFREGILSPSLSVVAQQGNTLGDKMYNAFCQAQCQNALPAIVLGTDSPTLPEEYLLQAEQAVLANNNAVVLGPSEDGGFYLMGLTHPHAQYFFGDNYSNTTVFRRTWEAVQQQGAFPIALPPWYDIDDKETFLRLCAEMLDNPPYSAYRTSAVVHSLQQRETNE